MRFSLLIFALLFSTSVARAELTFEKDIRPILKQHCFHCHGEGEELGGELDVRLRRLIAKGGESGTAIVPGDKDASLLLTRIRDGEMPPEEVKSRLSMVEIDRIGKWIAEGAKTARAEPESLDSGSYYTEEERSYWAFQPIRRVELPKVNDASRVRTPIDHFILAKLDENKLNFSADARREALLRRVCFDLTGLPPTREMRAEFLSNDSPDAYEKLIDHLLASPRYGERWGRHWLDVAGYADSEGMTDKDSVRPDAWKYRDYVIRSLNDDKPFDLFVREQLAGDEMTSNEFDALTAGEIEKLTATGFLRMAPDGTGTTNNGVARNEVIAKSIEIVSTSMLGLTVGCAQCHNHRYDPISQEDYYRFRAIFDPAYNWEKWKTPPQRRVSLYNDAQKAKAADIEKQAKAIEADRTKKQNEYIEAVFKRELAKLPAELHAPIRDARETPEKERTAEQKKLLMDHPTVNVTAGSLYLYDRKAADELKAMAAKAAKIRETKPKQEYVRALFEPKSATPPDSFLFSRGDHEQPRQKVQPGELGIILGSHDLMPNDETRSTTGRRLAYANWLTSNKHPLLARVIVNRIWLNHFGRGIVSTAGDFGFLGTRPTHPELLDWLASELVRRDWSVKSIHKMILMSTTYRQASVRTPERDAIDSDNTLYARMSVRRLDAEQLRDSVLLLGDQLNLRADGPAVPVMADRTGRFVIGKENLNAGRPGAKIDMKGEEFRRSVWIQVRRSRPLAVLDPFDLPRMEPNCTSRNSSTVAPQSLMLMNSDFAMTHALNVARHVQSEKDVAAQVRLAWQLVFAGDPSQQQISDSVAFVDAQQKYFAGKPLPNQQGTANPDPALEALASFCHALLSANEFLYVE